MSRAFTRNLITACVVALMSLGCTIAEMVPTPDASSPDPVVTRPLPFTEGNCAGSGRDDLRVAGHRDAPEPVWAEADGGERVSITWPRGSVAVFGPELTVMAPDGTTLARQDDRIGDRDLNGREICISSTVVMVYDRSPIPLDASGEPVLPSATPRLPPVEEFAQHVRAMADGRDLERALEVANADSRSVDEVHFAMEELSALLEDELRWYATSTTTPCFRDVHERYGAALQALGAARAQANGWVESGASDDDRQLAFGRIRAVAPQFPALAAQAEDAVRRCP